MIALLLGCASEAPLAPGCPDTAPYAEAPTLEAALTLGDLDLAVMDAVKGGAVHPLGFFHTWEGIVEDLATLGPNDGTDLECQAGFADSTTIEGRETAICYAVEGTQGAEYAVSGLWLGDLAESYAGERTIRQARVIYSFQATRLATSDALYAGGSVDLAWTARSDGMTFDLRMTGTYLDTGAAGALGDGVGAGTRWSGDWSLGEGFVATFDGPTGAGNHALDFRQLRIDHTQGPGPIGTLLLRDPSGGWWELALEDDYSGCGTASFSGEVVGETCAGISVVLPLDALFRQATEAGW